MALTAKLEELWALLPEGLDKSSQYTIKIGKEVAYKGNLTGNSKLDSMGSEDVDAVIAAIQGGNQKKAITITNASKEKLFYRDSKGKTQVNTFEKPLEIDELDEEPISSPGEIQSAIDAFGLDPEELAPESPEAPENSPPSAIYYRESRMIAVGRGMFPYECTAKDEHPDAMLYYSQSGGWAHEFDAVFLERDVSRDEFEPIQTLTRGQITDYMYDGTNPYTPEQSSVVAPEPVAPEPEKAARLLSDDYYLLVPGIEPAIGAFETFEDAQKFRGANDDARQGTIRDGDYVSRLGRETLEPEKLTSYLEEQTVLLELADSRLQEAASAARAIRDEEDSLDSTANLVEFFDRAGLGELLSGAAESRAIEISNPEYGRPLQVQSEGNRLTLSDQILVDGQLVKNSEIAFEFDAENVTLLSMVINQNEIYDPSFAKSFTQRIIDQGYPEAYLSSLESSQQETMDEEVATPAQIEALKEELATEHLDLARERGEVFITDTREGNLRLTRLDGYLDVFELTKTVGPGLEVSLAGGYEDVIRSRLKELYTVGEPELEVEAIAPEIELDPVETPDADGFAVGDRVQFISPNPISYDVIPPSPQTVGEVLEVNRSGASLLIQFDDGEPPEFWDSINFEPENQIAEMVEFVDRRVVDRAITLAELKSQSAADTQQASEPIDILDQLAVGDRQLEELKASTGLSEENLIEFLNTVQSPADQELESLEEEEEAAELEAEFSNATTINYNPETGELESYGEEYYDPDEESEWDTVDEYDPAPQVNSHYIHLISSPLEGLGEGEIIGPFETLDAAVEFRFDVITQNPEVFLAGTFNESFFDPSEIEQAVPPSVVLEAIANTPEQAIAPQTPEPAITPEKAPEKPNRLSFKGLGKALQNKVQETFAAQKNKLPASAIALLELHDSKLKDPALAWVSRKFEEAKPELITLREQIQKTSVDAARKGLEAIGNIPNAILEQSVSNAVVKIMDKLGSDTEIGGTQHYLSENYVITRNGNGNSYQLNDLDGKELLSFDQGKLGNTVISNNLNGLQVSDLLRADKQVALMSETPSLQEKVSLGNVAPLFSREKLKKEQDCQVSGILKAAIALRGQPQPNGDRVFAGETFHAKQTGDTIQLSRTDGGDLLFAIDSTSKQSEVNNLNPKEFAQILKFGAALAQAQTAQAKSKPALAAR